MEEKKNSVWKKIVLIILIIVLIALMVLGAVEFIKRTNKNENEVEIESSKQQAENNLEEFEEIYLYGEEIRNILKKFNFSTSVEGSIYKTGDFDKENIPNALILRMAWDKLDKKNDTTINEAEGESTQTAKQTVIEKSVKNLLGNDATYEDESFENIDSATFEMYNYNPGKIVYNDDLYTAEYREGGGGTAPYIYGSAEKALKKDNKIEIYVKTAFVKTTYDEETEDVNSDFYSDFDFEKEEFVNKVKTVEETKFFEDIYEYANDNEGTILAYNPTFNEFKEKLNTYVYTFEKDENTDDYYLVSFSKLNDTDKSISMSEKNMQQAKKERILGEYLSIYALRDCIQTPAYEILNLPNIDEDPTKSNETVLIEGQEYDLYQTKTKFEDYKKAMLNYVTEEIFEQRFTIYQKNVNGTLYMVLNAGDGKRYEILDMIEISENTYEVKCNYYEGESPAVLVKFIVTFEKSDDSYVIKSISTKILEDVESMEVAIEDEASTERTSI